MRRTIPIICKILLAINIILFISELLINSMVTSYCLSPARILVYWPNKYVSSLFISNYFHLNPMQSGPMGIFHILMNMMTLISVGSSLEKEFGSIAFIGITLFFSLFIGPLQVPLSMFTEFISMGKVSLLSTHQCGIGFSGILFGYFIIYLKFIVKNDEMTVYGVKCRKWILPFAQLLILSFLLSASFIGHLSGIIMGYIYISGFPLCFELRHALIKKIENLNIISFITNRNDFHCASQQPIINQFTLNPCKNNNNSSLTVSYSRVGNIAPNNNGTAVEMTCVNGNLVPKSSVDKSTSSQGNSLL